MKLRIFICLFISAVISVGCSEVYIFKFDRLLLVPVASDLNAPDYLNECRVEIRTSDDFNTEWYEQSCAISDILAYDYSSYIEYWNLEESGVLSIPSGKGKLTVFSNDMEYNEKLLELTYDNGTITSYVGYTGFEKYCDFKGSLVNYSEPVQYYILEGEMKNWYRNSGGKLKKTLITKGYRPNCAEFTIETTDYYETGDISQQMVERYYKMDEGDYYEGDGYTSEVIFKFNADSDGAQMNQKQKYERSVSDDWDSNSTKSNSNNTQPNWLKGSWRTPLGDTGALIVYLSDNYANVKIMRGFTVVQDITYDNWTILGNMLYLIIEGERVNDSPSFYIDFDNKVIIGHTGERFQKH